MNKTILLILLLLLISTHKTYAFKLGIHENKITIPSLLVIDFDQKSASSIGHANKMTDIYHPGDASAHADGNQLAAASARLDRLRTEVVEHLKLCNKTKAVEKLGAALHTVQDTYSHTNAIDNGLTGLLENGGILHMRDGTPMCNGENGTFKPGSLVSGYFSLGAFIRGLPLGLANADIASCYGTKSNPTGYIEAGNCCHLHLNKDNSHQLNGINFMAAQDAAIVATMTYLDLVYEKIDELYPEDSNLLKKRLKNNQLTTMYVVDTTGSMEKDIVTLKSNINNFIDSIQSDTGTKAPSLGLVTFKDEKEGMSTGLLCDLEEFRSHVNKLTAIGGDDCPEASALAVLKAFSFFDTGLLSAPYEGGEILLYTDAPPSNPDRLEELVAIAQNKGIRVNSTITEGCDVTPSNTNQYSLAYNQSNEKSQHQYSDSSVKGITSKNAFYQSLSEGTGGISLNVTKDEMDEIIPITTFIADTETEIIFSRKVVVKSKINEELNIKIDGLSTTGKTLFVIQSTDGSSLPNVVISRPDKSTVTNEDANAVVTVFGTLIAYQINSPIAGNWKIALSEVSSTYQVKVYSQTDFSIAGLHWFKPAKLNVLEVEQIPLEGNPVAGEELILRIDLTHKPEKLFISFERADQSIILEPVLNLIEGSNSSYEALFIVPNEKFHLKLTGLVQGSEFQREIPLMTKPTNIQLELDEVFGYLYTPIFGFQDQTKSVNLHVTNNGTTTSTLLLKASSPENYTVHIENKISIAAGETITIPVLITIPADAIVGSMNEIMLMVDDISDQSNSNFKVAQLIVKSDTIFVNGFE